MNEVLRSLPWHDAVILAITVDRSQPGAVDEVRVAVLWPDDRRSQIVFVGCYELDLRMNFGVVAAETVRATLVHTDSEDLRRIRERWGALGVDLSALVSVVIETNATASVLTVHALDCRIEPC